MINRRQLIGGSIGGFFAFAARNNFAHLFGNTISSNNGRAKRCLVLWMEGGPSQIDTFDPKPDTENGGPTKAISTSADLQISELLPNVALKMDQLSVVRNLTSDEGDHLRARYYLHTGFKFVPSFPRPALGSLISHESQPSAVPKYVVLGGSGFGPAFLGSDHAPFTIQDSEQARQLLDNVRRRGKRLALLRELDQPFNSRQNDERLDTRRALLEKIDTLAATKFSDSLSIEDISEQERTRYGRSNFGSRCLVARRLLETGVNFVEVQLGGWDTHANNFGGVQRNCEQLDRPFAALVEDLKSSGMYDDTLIIWMGEFGRTPSINGRMGRDHFPAITPVVMGGGPVTPGIAVGKTSSNGQRIEGSSYQVADLFATILSAFGVAPDKEFTTDFDSPTHATEDGQVISELLTV